MEDPDYPYAMGVLLPSIDVNTTDKNWKEIDKIKCDPEIMFKNISVKDFQIFLERNHVLSRIDKIIKLDEIKDSFNFKELVEVRLKEHIN